MTYSVVDERGNVVAPLVMCADCDHSTIEQHTGDPCLTCWVRKSFGLKVSPDDFCSKAAPKRHAQDNDHAGAC